jgi:hypothetical protein
MGSAALKGCHEVQNIGAVETYQRRYLWVTAMEIVEHDALDATNGKEAPEGRAKAALKPAMELVMPSFDTLPAEEQEFILNVAMEITAAINDEDMTEAHRLASSLDNDEKLALWSRLDSKQRSALKRHAESLKG